MLSEILLFIKLIAIVALLALAGKVLNSCSIQNARADYNSGRKPFAEQVYNSKKKPKPYIIGPKEGIEGQVLHFTGINNPEGGKWFFGESVKDYTKGEDVFYTYTKAGDYLIRLKTPGDSLIAAFKVKIYPGYQSFDSLYTEKKQKEINAEMKYYMQLIADGREFEDIFNHLVKKYLCGDKYVPIVVNDKETIDFSEYCVILNVEETIHVKSVNVKLKNNCAVSIRVVDSS